MPDSHSPAISVVVPCYRSAQSLPDLVGRVTAALDERTAGSFEIILVNDDSRDDTWETIGDLAISEPRVIGIDLMKNVGQTRALLCGLEHSTGSVVVTMDDDLQHPPEEIPRLLDALQADPNLDAVMSSYQGTKKHAWTRNIGSRLMGLIFRFSYGKPKDLRMSSFRAMHRSVVEGMLSFGTARPVQGALLLQTTSRIANVPTDHQPRVHGKSGHRFFSLISTVLDNLINASTAPLRVISGIGILTSLAAAGLIVFYFLRSLFGSVGVPGFATLVLLVVFFGGTTLLAIGVVGEYVARLVSETTNPPRYLVRATTRQNPER